MRKSSNINHPFPGLNAYGYHESDFFSGRDRQKHQLLNILSESNFVAVLGSNGVGKTSFVNSEILPELNAGFISKGIRNWKIAAFRPGKTPLGALATALSRVEVVQSEEGEKTDPNLSDKFENILQNNKYGIIEIVEKYKLSDNSNILLYIDHLDDLIFYSGHEAKEAINKEISLFVNRLVEVINQSAYPISVIATLRTEIAGHFTKFPLLAEDISKNQFLLGSLNRTDLLPIFKQITATGTIAFDPDFLEYINNFYKSNPLVLGKFQHAMKQCVDKWNEEGRVGEIGLSHLEVSGGLDQAISYQLDDIYGYLSKQNKETCRLIFQAITGITTTGETFTIPRTIQKISEITNRNSDEIIEVVKKFTAKNCGIIKVFDAQDITGRLERLDHILDESDNKVSIFSEITIAQDLILKEWPRLTKWIKEERLNAIIYLDIAKDVAKKEPPYEGEKLKAIWKWCEKCQPHYGWAQRYRSGFKVVQEFLLRSKNLYDKEVSLGLAKEISRKKKARRSALIVTIFTIVSAFLIGLDIYLGNKTLNEREAALRARNQASEASIAAQKAQAEADTALVLVRNAYLQVDKASALASTASMLADQAMDSVRRAQEETKKEKAIAQKSRNDAELAKDQARKLNIELSQSEKDIKARNLELDYLKLLGKINKLSGNATELIETLRDEETKIAANLVSMAYDSLKHLIDDNKFDSLMLKLGPDSVRLKDEYREGEKKLISAMANTYQNLETATNSVLSVIKYGTVMDKYPKKNRIAVGTDQNKIFEIDISKINDVLAIDNFSTSEKYKMPGNLTEGIRSIKYSKSGRNLYSGTVEGLVRLDSRSAPIHQIKRSDIIAIFTLTESDIITADRSGLFLYNKTDLLKNSIALVDSIDLNHRLFAVDFSDKDQYLITNGELGELKKLKVDSVSQSIIISETMKIGSLNSQITSLKILNTASKNWVAIGTQEGELLIYSQDERRILFQDDNEHVSAINCFEINKNKDILISGGRDNVINIWQINEIESLIKEYGEKVVYHPIGFKEFQPIQDLLFIENSWFFAVSRGQSDDSVDQYASGRVSIWSVNIEILKTRLDKLKNKWEMDLSEIPKKYLAD